MPPNAPDVPGLVRARPPRRLIVEHGGLITRGLGEMRPKRLHYPKLAATLVRQLAHRSRRPLTAVTALMPLAGEEAELTLELLSEMPRLSLGAPVVPALLDQLSGVQGRTLLAVLGAAEPPENDAHAAFARALATHDRTLEPRLAHELVKEARAATPASKGFAAAVESEADALVVEERPGKAYVLRLEEPTLKLAGKRWLALTGKDSGKDRAPLPTLPGWGLGAMVVQDPVEPDAVEARTGRVVSVASLDLRLTGESFGLDTGHQLRVAAESWLSGLGLSLGGMKRIVISVPWLAVSAFLAGALAPAEPPHGPAVVHPDQVYGWQPLLTLLGFAAQPVSLPALLVYSGRHPAVHLAVLW